HVYTLKIDHVLRGKTPKTVQIYDGNDSGRTLFNWIRGRKYILFMFYLPQEKAWGIDSCGNSGPLSKAESTLSEIAAIQSAHSVGVIHGVVSQEALSQPIAGVHVEASGAKGTFRAIANEKGEFEIQVPGGQYKLHAEGDGLSFQKADISYEDPDKLQVYAGGCAQVQIVGTAKQH
ncbi:MAG: carboxypeptidase regulatory-like domain-containing protein, partial [Acidobacteriota bacterium]|nr:carboxypeptidase regulatory-like domain-containing protein [Acidobacteriota bacterium]